MRFPLALSAKIARHIITNKIKRTEKFALVLQLEPLHTCNLTCTGCGRIREYSTSLKDMMSLEDCLGLRGRMQCADGLDLRWRTDSFIRRSKNSLTACSTRAASFTSAPTACSCARKMRESSGPHLQREENRAPDRRIAREEADHRKGSRRNPQGQERRPPGHQARANGCIGTSTWTAWNTSHDLIVEREGVFKECIEAIKMAKMLGYQVATQHARSTKRPTWTRSRRCSISCRPWAWTATPSPPATSTMPPRRT